MGSLSRCSDTFVTSSKLPKSLLDIDVCQDALQLNSIGIASKLYRVGSLETISKTVDTIVLSILSKKYASMPTNIEVDLSFSQFSLNMQGSNYVHLVNTITSISYRKSIEQIRY